MPPRLLRSRTCELLLSTMLSTLTYVAGFSASKDYATLFLAFKHEHAKHYDSAAAEAQAFKAFSENEDIIASHNAIVFSRVIL